MQSPTVPETLVRQWEIAYHRYGSAWETTGRSVLVSTDMAQAMASTSAAVASAWRNIAAVRVLPWWALAAVHAAADAFDGQAREWDARPTGERA